MFSTSITTNGIDTMKYADCDAQEVKKIKMYIYIIL